MKLFLVLYFLSAFARAQDCGTINYLTQENSPFEKIPVADQDGVGICYAYTASQLLNYHILKTNQATEPVMHPVWVALKSSRRILTSGNELSAINAVNNAGNCNYDRVEGALNLFSNNSNLSGSPLVSFLETYARSLERQARGRQANQSMIETAQNEAMNDADSNCSEEVIWERLLPQLSTVSETSVQLFTRLLQDSCSPQSLNRFQTPRAVDIYPFETHAHARSTMNTQISKGPFIFGYCSETWTNPNYNGYAQTDRKFKAVDANCGMHSSMMVGRKQIGPHCYMLVRNSWGIGWGDWNANQKCICRHKVTREWVDECTFDEHGTGDYTVEACYIGQNQMSRNVQNITTIYR